MKTAESRTFISLSDLEFIAGQTTRKNDRVLLKQVGHFPGKEFEDVIRNIKGVMGEGSIAVEAALPVSIISLRRDQLADGDAVTNQLIKATGLTLSDLRVLWMDPESGHLLHPGDHFDEVAAVCFSKKALAVKMVQLALLEVADSTVTCRAMNIVGSILVRMRQGFINGPVLFLDMLGHQTQVFYIAPQGVRGMGSVDTGLEQVIEQVMELLELRFRASAAKLFYGDIYDFDEHAAALVKPVADKVSGRVGSIINKLPQPPRYLFTAGLPLSRNKLLCSALADRLQLAPLEMPNPLGIADVSLPAYVLPTSPGLTYSLVHSADEAETPPFLVNLDTADNDWKSLALSLVQSEGTAPKQTRRVYRGVVYDEGEPEVVPESNGTGGGMLASLFKSKAAQPPSTPPPVATSASPAQEAPKEPVPKKIRMYRGVAYEVD